MDIAIWALQIILALAFVGAGAIKLAKPKPALVAQGMGYAEDFSDSAIKGIGALEIVGALGLILPKLTGILPVLTPIAAIGLFLVMAGAVVVHIRRKEQFVSPLVLGLLSLVLAVLLFTF